MAQSDDLAGPLDEEPLAAFRLNGRAADDEEDEEEAPLLSETPLLVPLRSRPMDAAL